MYPGNECLFWQVFLTIDKLLPAMWIQGLTDVSKLTSQPPQIALETWRKVETSIVTAARLPFQRLWETLDRSWAANMRLSQQVAGHSEDVGSNYQILYFRWQTGHKSEHQASVFACLWALKLMWVKDILSYNHQKNIGEKVLETACKNLDLSLNYVDWHESISLFFAMSCHPEMHNMNIPPAQWDQTFHFLPICALQRQAMSVTTDVLVSWIYQISWYIAYVPARILFLFWKCDATVCILMHSKTFLWC